MVVLGVFTLPFVGMCFHLLSLFPVVATTTNSSTSPADSLTTDRCKFLPFQIVSYPDVITCALNVPYTIGFATSYEARNYTTSQIISSISALYAFGDLVQNSTDAPEASLPQSLIDRGWEVHKMNVDWRGMMTKITRTRYKNVFNYHHDMWSVFNSFYDAHTTYAQPHGFPFYFVLPFRFDISAEHNKLRKRYEMVVRLNENPDTQAYNNTKFIPEPIFPEKHFGNPVKSINGIQAVKYIQSLGDILGKHKDRGVRFNEIVVGSALGWGSLQLPLLNFGNRSENGMKIVFEDNSTLETIYTFTADIVVNSTKQLFISSLLPSGFNREALALINGEQEIAMTEKNLWNANFTIEDINMAMKPDADLPDFVKQEILQYQQSMSAKVSATSTPSPTLSGYSDFEKPDSTFSKQPRSSSTGNRNSREYVSRKKARRSSDGDDTAAFVGKIQSAEKGPFKDLHKLYYTQYGQLVGALFLVDGVPVVKYPSMMPVQAYDRQSFVERSIALFRDAAALGVQSNSSRCVVDVSGNPGGLLELSYTLLSMVSRDLDTHRELCGPIDIPITDGAEYVMTAFNYTDPEKLKANMTIPQLMQMYSYIIMRGLKYFLKASSTANLFRAPLLRYLDVLASPSFTKAPLDTQNELLTRVRKEIYPYFADPTGWYPFSAWGATTADTMEPYKRSLMQDHVTLTRGGVKRKYSRRFIPRYCAEIPLEGPQSPRGSVAKFFDEVVVFTDGRCGSACSAFVTQLLAAKEAKVVSAGGRLGFPMDTSSFRGGSVQSSDDWVRDYLSWMSIGLALKDDMAAMFEVPQPVIDASLTYINFANGYSSFAGNSSLPIEFYRKPADRHWWVWPMFGVGNHNGEWFKLPKEQMRLWGKVYKRLAKDKFWG